MGRQASQGHEVRARRSHPPGLRSAATRPGASWPSSALDALPQHRPDRPGPGGTVARDRGRATCQGPGPGQRGLDALAGDRLNLADRRYDALAVGIETGRRRPDAGIARRHRRLPRAVRPVVGHRRAVPSLPQRPPDPDRSPGSGVWREFPGDRREARRPGRNGRPDVRPSATPPDVAEVHAAVSRLGQLPGQAKFAFRLQVDLAALAFFEGHFAEARGFLPSRDDPGADPEYAAAELRDMQSIASGQGEPRTWPAQEVAKKGERPESAGTRRPPRRRARAPAPRGAGGSLLAPHQA